MPVVQSPGNADMPPKNQWHGKRSQCVYRGMGHGRPGANPATTMPHHLVPGYSGIQGSHRDRKLKVWGRDNLIKEIIKDAVG